jgi:hypothetical protein
MILDQKEMVEEEKNKIGTLQRLMRDLPKLEKLLDWAEKNPNSKF